MLLSQLLVLSATVISVFGFQRNVTIDDKFGDELTGALPTYSASCRQASKCPECAAKANTSLAYLNDWHDCYPGAVNFSFTGSAVYIYGIWDTLLPVDSEIVIDGQSVGKYSIDGNATAASVNRFIYNQQLFAMQGIAESNHTVNIISEQAFLFDYAFYTMETQENGTGSAAAPTSSPSSANQQTEANRSRERAAILLPAILIPVMLTLIGVLTVYITRRRRRVHHAQAEADELEKSYTPYEAAPPAESMIIRGHERSDSSGHQEALDHVDVVPYRSKLGALLPIASNARSTHTPALPAINTPPAAAHTRTPSSSLPENAAANSAGALIGGTSATGGVSMHDTASMTQMNAQMAHLQDQMAELRAQMRAASYQPPPVYDDRSS